MLDLNISKQCFGWADYRVLYSMVICPVQVGCTQYCLVICPVQSSCTLHKTFLKVQINWKWWIMLLIWCIKFMHINVSCASRELPVRYMQIAGLEWTAHAPSGCVFSLSALRIMRCSRVQGCTRRSLIRLHVYCFAGWSGPLLSFVPWKYLYP